MRDPVPSRHEAPPPKIRRPYADTVPRGSKITIIIAFAVTLLVTCGPYLIYRATQP